jgi:isoleucyl-tRNA synthetase
LDRWLLSELHTLVREVTEAFEAYDVPGTTRPIQSFVDSLSKWYLRRSRRRFWKSDTDADKLAAYATLYEVLVTLSKLLAPSMPFLAEEIYQNLVIFGGSADGASEEAAESVHLAAWPEANASLINETLNQDMKLVMRLASLGHSARSQASIKVRQPLAQAAFSIGNLEEAQVIEKYAGLLADELNVKHVTLLGSAGEAVEYSLKPLPRQLGQKHKGDFPKISRAIETLEAEPAAGKLMNGQAIQVFIDGNPIEVLPDEVEVRLEARSGLVVSVEGPYLAALSTDLTNELILEGLAREFVRRVQDYRKQTGFEIADRIILYVQATDQLNRAIEMHLGYITGETLAVALIHNPPPEEVSVFKLDFDNEKVTIGAVKSA